MSPSSELTDIHAVKADFGEPVALLPPAFPPPSANGPLWCRRPVFPTLSLTRLFFSPQQGFSFHENQPLSEYRRANPRHCRAAQRLLKGSSLGFPINAYQMGGSVFPPPYLPDFFTSEGGNPLGSVTPTSTSEPVSTASFFPMARLYPLEPNLKSKQICFGSTQAFVSIFAIFSWMVLESLVFL